MLFNSYVFIFSFLPLTLLVYFYLNKKNLHNSSRLFLVFSSLFFYAWWNINYLPIIVASIVVNYAIGNFLQRISNGREIVLTLGIGLNLLLLVYFKYLFFFVENFNVLFNSSIEVVHLALPLAISFFTFQQISYLVGSYRGETAKYNFLDYSLFVTFFPQLIAGPIVYHTEMIPQFSNPINRKVNAKNMAMGIFIFSIGLFKKVIIADSFATSATAGFDMATTLNLAEAWMTSLSYTFQIYFDFSGYTDMAIGIALLFNIKLPVNFNSPYKALNIQDFWRRWHITLSRFLREYIYIPLGGNRRGEFVTYVNLMITFILGGLWHGASWTFVFWGFLHALALIIHRIWLKIGFKLWRWIAWIITFNFINITWIFFRAKEWDDAIKVLSSMFSFDNIVLPRASFHLLGFLEEYGVVFGFFYANLTTYGVSTYLIFWLFLAFILLLVCKNSIEALNSFRLNYRTAFFIAFLFTAGVVGLNSISEFLYFNF